MDIFTQKKAQYLSIIKKVYDYSKELNLSNSCNLAIKCANQMKDDSFRIVVVGEFSRGKSTLLNSLLRVNLLPTSEQETTATINILRYAENPEINIFYSTGKIEKREFNFETLNEYTALKDFDSRLINHININYPCEYLKNNVEIVDTPGVNDPDEHRNEITLGYIPNANVILFILDAKQAFTLSEKRFITDYILKNKISSIFFILNRIDEVSPENRERVLQSAIHKIEEATQITSPIVIPLSALDAYEAIINQNEVLYSESGFEIFTKKLNSFLNSDEKVNAKLDWHKNQIFYVLNNLNNEIQREIDMGSKSVDELEKIKEDIAKKEEDLRSSLNDIFSKVDLNFESVLSSIQNLLYNKYQDFKEQLFADIKVQKSNLKDFADSQIPIRYKRFIKDWLDRYTDVIDQQLRSIAYNAVKEFEKSFSKKAILDLSTSLIKSTASVSAYKMNFDLEDYSNKEKLAMGGGALLLGGVVLATGGLAIIPLVFSSYAGIFAGKNLFNTFILKKEIEKQKDELLYQLDAFLRKDENDLSQHLSVELSQSFTLLKSTLEDAFNKNVDEINKDLSSRISNVNEKQLSFKQKVGQYDKIKKETINIINSLN